MSTSNQSKIEQLLALGVEGLDAVRANNVLQNHNWDVQQAANSLFSGALDATPDDEMPGLLPSDWPVPASQPNKSPEVTLPTFKDFERNLNNAHRDETRSVELRDNVLAGALTASGTSTFGPSNREDPAQQWAMVPAKPQASQEVTDMDKAIEASLNETFSKAEEYKELPCNERVRVPACPVALRLTQPVQSDALFLQALFAIPQVRSAFSSFIPVSTQKPFNEDYWRGAESYPIEEAWDTNSSLICVQHVQRLFAFMTLSRRAYLNVDETVKLLTRYEVAYANASLLPNQAEFPQKITDAWAASNSGIGAPTRLTGDSSLFRSVLVGDSDGSTVQVDVFDIQHASPFNDLLSWLRKDLAKGSSLRPAEVLTFHVYRTNEVDSAKVTRTPFTFPVHLFCDEFLSANRAVVNERREVYTRAEAEIERLERKKQALLHPANKDTLRTLDSASAYFEQYARADLPERHTSHQQAKERLQSIRGRIVFEAEAIDEGLRHARAAKSAAFNSSELTRTSYKLRAVVIDDGQYGRRHTFAYLSDFDHKWWKVVDNEVLEVDESSVLNDTTGVHLGGGVSMLLYSRDVPFDNGSLINLVQQPYKGDVVEDNKRLDDELGSSTRLRPIDVTGDASNGVNENFVPATGQPRPTVEDFEMDVDTTKPS